MIYLDYTFLGGLDKDIMSEIEANQETFEKVPFASLKKSLEITDYYEDDIANKMNFLRGIAINGGVQMFDEGKYEESYASFAGAVEMSDVIGYKDTVAMFNAALSADKLDKYDEAIKYYHLAAEANYLGNAEVYRNIIQVVNRKNEGPSDEAFKYIEEAKAKYPGDINIIIEEFNYHNSKGNADAAQASLQEAIKKDPRNPIFHYSIGATFDELANTRHEEGKHDEARLYVDKAVEAYSKSIELDPKFADAYYNLGVLYNNESFSLTNEMKSIEDVKLQEEKLKESRELLKKAIPFLEKSNELTPTDVNTLKLLKSIYFTVEDMDNYNVVAEKLKALGQ
jgi:tetratricopeptide (TPR) repeat protein